MDISEADRLTRDFAQHTQRDRKEPSMEPQRWETATVWTATVLFAAAFLGGVAIAFS
ncbi:hypothetical protein D3C87_1639000 [compost metagenome]